MENVHFSNVTFISGDAFFISQFSLYDCCAHIKAAVMYRSNDRYKSTLITAVVRNSNGFPIKIIRNVVIVDVITFIERSESAEFFYN